MRRIAVISFHTCPFSRLGVMDAGGMNVYILELYKALAQMGWQIDVYTRKRGYEPRDIVSRFSGFRVIHIPLATPHDIPKKELRNHIDEFSDGVAQFIKENTLSYQLFHAHYYLSGLVALQLKKHFSLPLIATFHTLGLMKKRYGGTYEEKRITDEETIARIADSLVVSTPLEQKELENYYRVSKDKINVVTPGVDHAIFKPRVKSEVREKLGLPQDRKIILFAGRIDPIKGITVLIEALGKLRTEKPDFHTHVTTLLIGGDIESDEFWQIPEVVKIQKLLREKNIECCVEFLGAKTHEELAFYYSASDIVVLPSFYESFSLVKLEAMATESAIVASRVGGLQFLVTDGKNGVLFQNKNSRELAEKIWYLLENEEFRRRLGEAAYQFSLQFSWEKQAKKMTGFYNALLTKTSYPEFISGSQPITG